MSIAISVLGVIIFLVACIYYWKIKASFASKYGRRRELQSQFAAFAAANRVIEMDRARIDEFWKNTSDAWHYFTSNDVHHLRQALYDNSLNLISINEELTFCHSGSQLYTELIDRKKLALSWFEDTLQHMEPIFLPESKEHPSHKDVLNECLRRLGRVLRT